VCVCRCQIQIQIQCPLTSTGGTDEHHPWGITAREPHGLLGSLDGGADGRSGGFLELVDLVLQLRVEG
jgi:hypothetical protein